MKRQRGIALGQLLFWGFLIAVALILSMKTVPSVMEYFTIMKNIKAVAGQAGADSSVQEIRSAYMRYAEIDNISSIDYQDLEIYKENGQIAISFAYEKKIRMFGPVSIVIDYQGSTVGGR